MLLSNNTLLALSDALGSGLERVGIPVAASVHKSVTASLLLERRVKVFSIKFCKGESFQFQIDLSSILNVTHTESPPRKMAPTMTGSGCRGQLARFHCKKSFIYESECCLMLLMHICQTM